MTDVHYLVGRDLRDRVPPGQSDAYYEGMLSTRKDAKPQRSGYHWVDDPRVKKGGYWRKNPGGGRPVMAQVQGSGNRSRRIASTALKVGLGVAAGAAVGAAAVAATRKAKQGIEQKVEEVGKTAQRKTFQTAVAIAGTSSALAVGTGLTATWATQRGLNQKIQEVRSEADARANAKIEAITKEFEQGKQAQIDQEVQRITAQLEAQSAQDIESRRAEVEAEAQKTVEARMVQARKELEAETRKQIETEVNQRLLAIQHEEAKRSTEQVKQLTENLTTRSQQELERQSQALQLRSQQELEKRVAEARIEIETRLQGQYNQQLEERSAQIYEEEQRKARESLVNQREEDTRRAREQVLKELEGDTRKGFQAVQLASGKLNPYTDEKLQDRDVKSAVTRLVNESIAQQMTNLAVELRSRMAEVEQIGGTNPTRNAQEQMNRERIRWQATDRALKRQARREMALQDEVKTLHESLTSEYMTAMAKVREQNYSPQAKENFEKRARSLNRRFQRDLDALVKSINEEIRLDRFR